MPSTSAMSVVANWRAGNHVRQWAPAAQGRAPSELNDLSAGALAEVARTADAQADLLVSYGFLPSHPTVKALRGLASTNARWATHQFQWATELRAVELQTEEET